MIILFTRDRVYTIFAGIFCLQLLKRISGAKIEFQYISFPEFISSLSKQAFFL